MFIKNIVVVKINFILSFWDWIYIIMSVLSQQKLEVEQKIGLNVTEKLYH